MTEPTMSVRLTRDQWLSLRTETSMMDAEGTGVSLRELFKQDWKATPEDPDAERFRALLRCGRISMQGSAGVDPKTGARNGNGVHFGAEFWPDPLPQSYRDEHPESTAKYDKSTAWGRFCIAALADAILESEAKAASK